MSKTTANVFMALALDPILERVSIVDFALDRDEALDKLAAGLPTEDSIGRVIVVDDDLGEQIYSFLCDMKIAKSEAVHIMRMICHFLLAELRKPDTEDTEAEATK